jgi:hypothetical protein
MKKGGPFWGEKTWGFALLWRGKDPVSFVFKVLQVILLGASADVFHNKNPDE